MHSPALTIPLDPADASLDLAGGKGMSLSRLVAAGLPVPRGLILSTRCYWDFVGANALQDSILEHVVAVASETPASAKEASNRIQSLFESANLPQETADAILSAYAGLGEDEPAVSVRSSATAEDLPEYSFAGLHDTYLNVRGNVALLAAVRKCWTSLWSPRAINYRMRMGIDQRTVAMAVVVQVMIPADVSGILFTANPTTGDRSEMIINSNFGLGEAVVGGQVTPDTYVLDRGSLQCKETTAGSKSVMIVPTGDQGTTTQRVPEAKRDDLSLSADLLQELAALGVQVEKLFDGKPQDIEWTVADRKCWLLQSRPITNLPPAPLKNVRWDPPAKGAKLIRRQVVENMPDPLSPLFAELYLQEGLDQSINQMLAEFGMPIDMDDFIERPMFVTVNGYAYCRASYRTWRMLRTMPRNLFWIATSLRTLIRNVIPHWRDEGLPAYLAVIDKWKAIDPAAATDEQLLAGVRALAVADAVYWFDVSAVLGAAKISEALLDRFLTSRFVRGELTSSLFLRGFSSESLEAQADLELLAAQIREADSLRRLVPTTPAGDLLQALQCHPGAGTVVQGLHAYFEKYGHQIYNLDFVQRTQVEDPLPVLLSLKSLVENESYDSRARQADMALECEFRISATLDSLGPVRRWLFRKLLGWAQTFCPHREPALFYMGVGWPTLRRLALELGHRLVEAGTLCTAGDVFYLETAELEKAIAARQAGRPCAEPGRTAQSRRELREARKRLHPPGMIPEGSRWKFGPIDFSFFETQKRNTTDADTLHGFAVSPGRVTGPASVILSAADFLEMKPDTVLVCPTTTPAWTPLFAQASGVVTDIGGILAHGSIVAREYGIPAVMGTGSGSRRIVSGQLITVDGDNGIVTLLNDGR